MSAWRTAIRVARREARRAKGRTALVLAMITLPVLFLSFAAATYDMLRLSPTERLARDIGTADAALRWEFDSPILQDPVGDFWIPTGSDVRPREAAVTGADLLAMLPPGSRAIPDLQGSVEMRTATGEGDVPTRGLDTADPLVRGVLEILSGRGPVGEAEVALSPQAAGRLGVRVGDAVRSADGTRSWTVVGTVEFPRELDQVMLFHPDGFRGGGGTQGHRWLVHTPAPLTWPDVQALNEQGIYALSRAVVLDPPPASEVPDFGVSEGASQVFTAGALIGGLGVLEIVLLAGPAFAVGSRRRRRDLALVAANGGTPAHLRRIVLADGLVLGAAGAIAGIGLGVAAAMLGRPLIEENLSHARAGGYRVFPLALLGIAAVAVLTGLLAALVPAFVAARQDVVNALTGRRGVVRSRQRWVVVGLAMAAAGTGMGVLGATRTSPNLILAGVVVGELGLVICTPALVGLISRVGRLLPLAPRIALRDTARNRASAAPAISAVMAAVAGAVALGTYLVSDRARQEAEYVQPMPPGYVSITTNRAPEEKIDLPLPAVEAAARVAMPVTDVFPVNTPACPPGAAPGSACWLAPLLPPERECPMFLSPDRPTEADVRAAARDERCAEADTGWSSGGEIFGYVDDGTLLGRLTGATGDDLARATATLRAGGVVLSDARLVEDGRITLNGGVVSKKDGTATQRQLPTMSVPGYAIEAESFSFLTVFSPGVVARAGFTVQPTGLVAATSRMPTPAEQDRLNASLDAVDGALIAYVERGPHLERDPALIVLAVAAGLITLGAAGIATGLAAADGRADLSTLAAVGASPRVRRLLSLSQSGVISGLGAVLGVAAGLGASFAVLSALNRAPVLAWPPPEPYPLAVPWSTLTIVLIVPLVAVLGAGLLTGPDCRSSAGSADAAQTRRSRDPAVARGPRRSPIRLTPADPGARRPGRARARPGPRCTLWAMSALGRLVRRLGHQRWFAVALRRVLPPVDRLIGQATKGRFVALGIVPSLLITTTGRKSGLGRTNPLTYARDGDSFVVIGSNWGQAHQPAWALNLTANPDATVLVGGREIPVRARLVTPGAERERLFALLVREWPAYATYVERAAGRDIRLFVLERARSG